jgi:hypothetical protein
MTMIFIVNASVDRKVMTVLLFLIFALFIYIVIEVSDCLLFEQTTQTRM